jgi:hypothetical protein
MLNPCKLGALFLVEWLGRPTPGPSLKGRGREEKGQGTALEPRQESTPAPPLVVGRYLNYDQASGTLISYRIKIASSGAT